MVGISTTRSIRFMRLAKDGLSFAVTNESAVFKKNSNGYFIVGIDLYEGKNKIPYGIDSGGFECSTLKVPDGLRWNYRIEQEGHTFSYMITKNTNGLFNTEIPYTITYKGVTYSRKISIKTVDDGERGEAGPILRGPQLWGDCKVGYDFQSGNKGEEYKDLVVYEDSYYSCVKSHTKNASNYPTSAEDQAQKYWQTAQKAELIASRVILAEAQIVKNLIAETVAIRGDSGSIVMRDSSGKTLLNITNGNITCNVGNFKNVEVEGTINADKGYFSGILKKKKIVIDDNNFNSFLKKHGNYYRLILTETGTFINFSRYFTKKGTVIELPQFRVSRDPLANQSQYDEVRALVGNTFLIYNNSDECITLRGYFIFADGHSELYDNMLYPNNMAYLTPEIFPVHESGRWVEDFGFRHIIAEIKV